MPRTSEFSCTRMHRARMQEPTNHLLSANHKERRRFSDMANHLFAVYATKLQKMREGLVIPVTNNDRLTFTPSMW